MGQWVMGHMGYGSLLVTHLELCFCDMDMVVGIVHLQVASVVKLSLRLKVGIYKLILPRNLQQKIPKNEMERGTMTQYAKAKTV